MVFKVKNIRKKNQGQSMIEILVAVALGGIFLGGAAILIVALMGTNKRIQLAQTAITIGNDLTESVRVLASKDWNSFYTLNKGSLNHYNISTSTQSYSIAFGDSTTTIRGVAYTSWFYIENVYRNATGDIVSQSAPGATLDPSTQFIVIRISWSNNPLASMTLSEFLTRNRNEAFQQSDWSGGGGQYIFPNDNVNNRFDSADINIDYSSSSGFLYLTGVGPASGAVTSSVFDTLSSSTLNLIRWNGSNGAGTWAVQFQIASSTSTNGPWNFVGPGNNPVLYYQAGNPGQAYAIDPSNFSGTRYFRYKLFISYNAGGSSPSIDDVIINYSP